MYGFFISLCPAPSIDEVDGNKRADCLSPLIAGEFPRAPAATATRRIKRDTGVFFCFVFCHATENEETISEKRPGSVKPFQILHQRRRV
jgi:hypothetical protein